LAARSFPSTDPAWPFGPRRQSSRARGIFPMCGASGITSVPCPPAFVAQLDRASAFEAEGWGFDSLRTRSSPLSRTLQRDLTSRRSLGIHSLPKIEYGRIAQLAEQRTLNPFVVGSIPTVPTKKPSGWRLNRPRPGLGRNRGRLARSSPLIGILRGREEIELAVQPAPIDPIDRWSRQMVAAPSLRRCGRALGVKRSRRPFSSRQMRRQRIGRRPCRSEVVWDPA
jgi:hypothetical protein